MLENNIFKILGSAYKEDIISNLLVSSINESKIFADKFLEAICDIKNRENYTCKAFTRISASEPGIPDIIILLSNKNETCMIIVENKLKADEGYEQTKRYSSDKCVTELANRLHININENFTQKFIYLTLIPEQIPTGELFINKTYENLLNSCKGIHLENEILDKLISDYMNILSEFYSNLSFKENDHILEVLRKDIDTETYTEKAFIKFSNIMKNINYTNGLKVSIGKAGGRGRASCIAQIYKGSWIREGMDKDGNNKWTLKPDAYSIHFEAAFDLFSKSINMPLHYEINPYSRKKWIQENIDKESYDKYLELKSKVQNALKIEIEKNHITNIKPYNGYNQILSIKLDIDEQTTVKEFKEKIATTTEFVSNIIDNILGNLN